MKKVTLGILFLIFHLSLSAQTAESKMIPLHSGINTEFSDYAPVISSDGKTLFFVREAHPQNYGPDNLADIWMTHKEVSGNWTRAVNIGAPLNNRYPNTCLATDVRGNQLYVLNNYRYGSNEGVAVSSRTNRLWSRPRQLQIENFQNLSDNINFHFSSDGTIMLSSVKRPRGYGHNDLYISFFTEDSKWTTPVNLGPNINTPGDELGIFLAPDKKTLYFSTNGLGGEGGQDLFMSRRLDNTWSRWSIPQNLGKSINTPADEKYISIPATGEVAYLSLLTEDGHSDIFEVKLPTALRPDPVAIISGQLIKNTSKRLTTTQIQLKDLDQDKEEKKVDFKEDGSFELLIPTNEKIGVFAESDGYLVYSEEPTTVNQTLEELDKDPGLMTASLDSDPAYLQIERDINGISLRLQKLDNELLLLKKEREQYLRQVQKDKALLDQVVDQSLIETDPELEALHHRYNNFLRHQQDTVVQPKSNELTVKGVNPKGYQAGPQAYDELEEMKKRFRNHYKIGQEEIKETAEEGYLWEAPPVESANMGQAVDSTFKENLREEIKNALLAEKAYKTKKAMEKDLRLELEAKIRQQEEVEKKAGYRIPSSYQSMGQQNTQYYPSESSYREINTNFVVSPVEEGLIIPLHHIFFSPNSADMKAASQTELHRVYKFLLNNPDLVVEIRAHTNGYLTHSFANQLSAKRAERVVQTLIEKGIVRERVIPKGYGKTLPLASNNTLEGRKKNQRIELKILKTDR